MGLKLTAALLALTLIPSFALAGDRWDRGDRSDRGYRYDRGERYQYRGGSNWGHRDYGDRGGYRGGYSDRSRSSLSLSFGFGNSCYGDSSSFRFSYSDRPVVYRDSYISRSYDYCPPPVVYVPAPRVYYYDAPSRYSGCETRYYYGR